MRARRLPGVVLAAAVVLAVAGPARAATVTVTRTTTSADPNTPVLVTDTTHPPAGYRLSAQTVEAVAARNPTARAELRRHPQLIPYEYTKGPGRWQVSWFTAPPHQRELLQIYVSDATGKVTEAWTGFQVAWTMARGYPGAFGRIVNAWWIWVPLCVLFFAPFLPVRPLRRPTLLHLDLLVLLGFSISLAFFNHAEIGLSVPLVYPFLLYLLARLLAIGFGRGRPREPLRVLLPVPWLAVALVFLIGFRIGLNVVNSNVIDVGYAGVIGATKILHGHALYGHWPSDNAYGDTYAPLNYLAYIPFRAVFGWSGVWDDLPAAHAAAIGFDLLTLSGLVLLGRRIRGWSLGILLAYAWAAYPFSLYTLSSNSNDALVSAVVVLALLAVGSAPGRGAAAALAGLTKFAPLALAPLLLRGTGPRFPRPRRVVAFVLAFALAAAAIMAYVVVHDNLHAFWKDTIAYQEGRGSPFSIWGLWGGLSFEQHIVQGAAAALALALAIVPRRRGLVEVTALAAAIIIALQLGLTHWFYLYIPWFFAPAIAALLGVPARAPDAMAEPAGGAVLTPAVPEIAPAPAP